MVVKDQIFGKGDTSLIVRVDHHGPLQRDSSTVQEIYHPHSFLRRLAKRHVLGFSRREGDALLLVGLPADDPIPYLDDTRADRPSMVTMTSPVSVREGGDLRAFPQPNTSLLSPLEVAEDSFSRSQ